MGLSADRMAFISTSDYDLTEAHNIYSALWKKNNIDNVNKSQ